MDGISVSVVIPTMNRRELLREALESLCTQTLDPRRYEIIVTDNCSSDGTEQMVRELAAKAPCPIVYHRMPENRGPARSRNTGVRLARAEIVAFTDSDCRVDPKWLETGIAAFDDPSVGLATGAIFHKPEQQITYFCRSHDPVTFEHPSYPAQNAWYRKKIYLEMGGFEETLCFQDFRNRPAECADTDLAWRIKEAGYKSVFLREMVIYHEIEVQTPFNWVVEPFRLFVVPLLIKRHPAIRPVILRWGLFFTALNVPFYLLAAGLIAAIAAGNSWFLLAAVPYFAFTARACYRRYNLPPAKMAGIVALMSMRQTFCCLGLLYGSVRFGRLVL
jgi:glycosyltransferase involved in cell wall biosynthesis